MLANRNIFAFAVAAVAAVAAGLLVQSFVLVRSATEQSQLSGLAAAAPAGVAAEPSNALRKRQPALSHPEDLAEQLLAPQLRDRVPHQALASAEPPAADAPAAEPVAPVPSPQLRRRVGGWTPG